MIRSREVVPLIEAAIPEFPVWYKERGLFTIRLDPKSEFGYDNYMVITALWTFTEELLKDSTDPRKDEVIDRICDVIEDIIAHGDESASAAACIEFVHSLSPAEPSFQRIFSRLGPRSRACWDDLENS
jgi:hypothetical protein